MEDIWFLVFFYMKFVTFGYGFLFDTSTPLTQIHGQSTPDKNYAALYELLLDEKRHRMELEQRVKVVETQTGYKEQNRKLEQLSNYVVQLEKEIQNLKMQSELEMQQNETIDSVARAHIVDVSSLLENKFQALNDKTDVILTEQQISGKTVTELQKNISDITKLKGIDQIQLLDTLRKRLDSVETKANVIISNAKARNQDFLALYNKTTFVETSLRNTIVNVENNLTMTFNLQIRNLSYEVERNQNISDMNLSKQKAKKVAFTSCMAKSGHISSGEVLPFLQIRSIVGINKTTQIFSNGTFVFKDAGLYLITITIATHQDHLSHLSILKNDVQIYEFYDQNSLGVHTGTGVVTIEAYKNDRVYVKSDSPTFLFKNWCCLTIVKIA